MRIEAPTKLLLIFMDETDTWCETAIPLYDAVVRKLFDAGIDGATVHSGIMGFGANRRVHKKGLFGVTDDRPITISVVENEVKLRAILPTLKEMVSEELLFLVDGEVVR